MKIIGESTVRTDAVGKLTGTALYTDDWPHEDTLHGALLRSPVPSGRIKRVDFTAAQSMPGVKAIVSAKDVPVRLAGWILMDQTLFADAVVRFEGEPILGVVANSRAEAYAAIKAIELEIEQTTAVGTPDEALEDGAPLVHPEWKSYQSSIGADYPRGGNIAAEINYDPGGIDEIFNLADHIIEDEFHSGRQYQAYLEPKAAIGAYQDGRYIIRTGSQSPYTARTRIAQHMGVRLADVRLIGQTMGGGFGAKLDAGLEVYAAILSRTVGGRPVRLVNTREEDLLTCPCRDDAIIRVRSAVDKTGKILARDVECLMNNGAYTGEMAIMPSFALLVTNAVYKADQCRVNAKLVYTNTAPTGAFRGVSGVYMYAALERNMDHIANELGLDRRKYRLDNLIGAGHMLLNGQCLTDAHILAEGFDRIEQVAPWDRLGESKKPLRGIGLCAGTWMTANMPGAVTLKLNEDGTVNVITGAVDTGAGAVYMGVTQIVAEALGLAPENVVIPLPDTDSAGFDAGAQGSRQTYIVGRAAIKAAGDMKKQILDVASNLLEVSTEDLELRDGNVGVVGVPDSQIPMGEVAAAATFTIGQIMSTGSDNGPGMPEYDPGCASGLLFPALTVPTYHVHLAEIEINPVTGNVKVIRYVVAQEVGKMINPEAVRGQVQGAVTQGIGHALCESLRIDKSKYVERTLESYRLPLAIDIPDVEFLPMEHADANGPYGAKGVGEPGILLVPATLGNAIYDAIGHPINKLPVTPEDILDLISSSKCFQPHKNENDV